MREYALYRVTHFEDDRPTGGGLEVTFSDYNYDGPRMNTVVLSYDDAFDLLDALAEELGQTLTSPQAYVFTPDWDNPIGEVISVDFRPDNPSKPSPQAKDCDGRCINCDCGYYEAPSDPPRTRLHSRWVGDGHGKHRGNDVY